MGTPQWARASEQVARYRRRWRQVKEPLVVLIDAVRYGGRSARDSEIAKERERDYDNKRVY